GVQNIAIFLITWPGVSEPTYLTRQAVSQSFFGSTGRSLDLYWREASYGKTSAIGAIFGVYTLSQQYGCSTTNNFDAIRTETLNQAAAAGVNLQSYSNFVFIAPDFGCGSSGIGTVGPVLLDGYTAGWSYIDATNWMYNTDDGA